MLNRLFVSYPWILIRKSAPVGFSKMVTEHIVVNLVIHYNFPCLGPGLDLIDHDITFTLIITLLLSCPVH